MTDVPKGWNLTLEYDVIWVNYKLTYQKNPKIYARSADIELSTNSDYFMEKMEIERANLIKKVNLMISNLNRIGAGEK